MRRPPGGLRLGACLAALALVASIAGCGPGSTPELSGSMPAPPGSAATSVASATNGMASAVPSASPAPSASPSPTASPPASAATGLPVFRHVYVIVMENEGYSSIVGSPSAPYINGLIARYALASAYDAVAHPSQPDYLALFSGSTQGVTDDGVHQLRAANLADQLETHGRTWQVFAENVPLGCFTGAVSHDGADGSGTYARKHEPAISFTSIASTPGRCARITDFSHFHPAASDFELIIPNMCNDMHDCSVATGDAFLAKFVPRITSSDAFADSVLFIVWDEGTGGSGGGGRVPLVIVSPLVTRGAVSAVPHTHYSLLHTIEAAWGLGCLANACGANVLSELFSR
jgi:hypothetical protein